MKHDEERWINLLKLSSIPLRKIDGDLLPVGIASGCLIDYLGRRVLLSVFHATKRDGNWGIEVRFEINKGTQIYRPGGFNYLGEMRLGSGKINEIDFSYVEVSQDLVSYYQEITIDETIQNETPRIVFAPDFSILPSSDELYGFSGQVLPEMHGTQTLVTQHSICHSLQYIDSENGYHIFKLPFPHPGHKQFEGCSGAPIIDTKGNVVALICYGVKGENTIYGISLAKYKIALDITYNGLCA